MAARVPSSLLPGPFVALDFETGDFSAASAIALGLVRVERGRVVRRVRQLFRPARVRVRFSEVHGLTWQDLHDKPTFAQAWPTLLPLLEGAAFLAAHNAAFDRGVLEASCAVAGMHPPDLPWVCTVRLARRVLGIAPASLDHVAKTLGFPLTHHEALSDAEACARIVMLARRAIEGGRTATEGS
jgi:DNA polymerase III subunit epsilon